MRARIDITEVEDATKIRAKYLRALENEEWNLLPGSTFVKSFLREYAGYLGLDGRALVEEYKHRYENPSEYELMPISPNLGGRDRRSGGRGGGGGGPLLPRWAVTLIGVVLGLGLLLWLIGSLGGDGDKGPTQADDPGSSTVQTQGTTPAQTSTTPKPPQRASVRLIPTGAVYVCLVDQKDKVLIPGTQFAAGQQVPLYRARSMRLTLGNNQVQMRVNGRPVTVPASTTAIAYTLTPSGARPLPVDQAPTCTS